MLDLGVAGDWLSLDKARRPKILASTALQAIVGDWHMLSKARLAMTGMNA